MPLAFFAIAALIVLLVLLDLYVLRPKRTEQGTASALGAAALWVLAAMALTFAVHYFYGRHPPHERAPAANEASLQFLASFLLECVLTLDSVFVYAAVFRHFNIPERSRHRMLLWGMLIALASRGALVLGLGTLLNEFAWVRFILAAFLVTAALRMILIRRENLDPDKNAVFRVLRRVLPMNESTDVDAPITVARGRASITPVAAPVLLIETADTFLAMDSLPASYAVTREPLLIFAATSLALLTVRSAAVPLGRITNRIRYFKIGLAMLLAYSAVVIALPASQAFREFAGVEESGDTFTTLHKLAFIAGAIVIGALVAALFGADPVSSNVSPLGEDADRIARHTLTGARKVVVFIIGVTGLVIGAVMAIGPGPGIPILFIALLVLAGEFVWARKLVNRYRPVAERAALRAAEHTRRRVRPWLLVVFVGASIGAGAALIMYTEIPDALVIASAIPFIGSQLFLGYLAFFRPPDAPPPRSAS